MCDDPAAVGSLRTLRRELLRGVARAPRIHVQLAGAEYLVAISKVEARRIVRDFTSTTTAVSVPELMITNDGSHVLDLVEE